MTTPEHRQPQQPRREWELLEHPPYSSDLGPSDFHLFGTLENHFVGRCFADDKEVETEVRKWLTTVNRLLCWGFRRTGKAMRQVYQCWLRICREINVFPRFGYQYFTFYIYSWPICWHSLVHSFLVHDDMYFTVLSNFEYEIFMPNKSPLEPTRFVLYSNALSLSYYCF
jgi:hypothetical protein